MTVADDDLERRVISLEPENPHTNADEVVDALMSMPGAPVIFQQGGRLVHVVASPPVTARQKAARLQGKTIAPVTVPFLREQMARVATYQTRRKAKDGTEYWTVVPPPKQLAEAILARNEWRFPALTGLLTAATLRPDFSVVYEPGYDARTGFFMAMPSDYWSRIPDSPDKARSLRGLAEWDEMLDEFAFSEPHDRSVALAMALTALVHHSIPAPIFGCSANVYGSGKTYLGQVAALLALGEPAPVMAPPRDPKEEAKALYAAALGGLGVLFIDNYERLIQSDALAAMKTSEVYADRVLAASEIRRVAMMALVVISGNNLVAAADITARILICRLDPKTDHPEHRRFKRDLHAWILENRVRLVIAGLTFLRGYIASGERPDAEPWQRYPDWDRLIRGALIWAGRPDPLLALRAAEKADPRRAEHESIMGLWFAEFRDKATPVRNVMRRAHDMSLSAADDHRLKDALLDVAGERGEVNAKKFGHWLKKMADRIVGGMVIRAGEPSRGSATWFVEVVGDRSPVWDSMDVRV